MGGKGKTTRPVVYCSHCGLKGKLSFMECRKIKPGSPKERCKYCNNKFQLPSWYKPPAGQGGGGAGKPGKPQNGNGGKPKGGDSPSTADAADKDFMALLAAFGAKNPSIQASVEQIQKTVQQAEEEKKADEAPSKAVQRISAKLNRMEKALLKDTETEVELSQKLKDVQASNQKKLEEIIKTREEHCELTAKAKEAAELAMGRQPPQVPEQPRNAVDLSSLKSPDDFTLSLGDLDTILVESDAKDVAERKKVLAKGLLDLVRKVFPEQQQLAEMDPKEAESMLRDRKRRNKAGTAPEASMEPPEGGVAAAGSGASGAGEVGPAGVDTSLADPDGSGVTRTPEQIMQARLADATKAKLQQQEQCG